MEKLIWNLPYTDENRKSIKNNVEKLISGPIKNNFWQFLELFGRFSDLVNSNICLTKIYWTKSNLPSKCDFKSDEDKNKHSLAPSEGTVKYLHTLFVCINHIYHCRITVKTRKKIPFPCEVWVIYDGDDHFFFFN